MSWRSRELGFMKSAALLVVLTCARLAWADVPLAAAPSVLVLGTQATPETARRERALYDQLSIALDDFAVLLTAPPVAGFSELTFPKQVAAVVPAARKEGAVAVVWLVLPAPRQVMVHLVAQSTGRSLVKTVEATTGPHAEATLALVVRELLGAAYLFEAPTALTPELRTVVTEVRSQVAAPPTPAPTPAPTPEPPRATTSHTFRLALLTAARFGDQVGGPFRGGAQAGWAFEAGPWVLSPTLELSTGPLEPGPLVVVAAEAMAGLDVFAPLTRGVSLGPFAAVQGGVRWQHAREQGERTTSVVPAALFHAGVRLGAPLAPGLGVSLEVALGARPLRSRLMLGDALLRSEGWGEVRTAFAVHWEVP